MSDSKVTLSVNGNDYDGWQTVSVSSGLVGAHSFDLSFTNPKAADEPTPIREQDECTVKIGGTVVVTGIIGRLTESYDIDSHTLRVEGRSKTANLVDGAALYDGSVIKGQSVQGIIDLIVEPYGVDIETDSELRKDSDFKTKIEKFKIEDGETAWEVIQRLADKRGFLAMTTREGALLLTRSAKEPLAGVTFERGVNVKQATRESNATERYSEYIFKSQKRGTDTTHGKDSAHLFTVIADPWVTSYRPKVIYAETPSGKGDLERRAIWERNKRAAEGERISVVVRGWMNPIPDRSLTGLAKALPSGLTAGDGDIISPNTIVRYRDDFFGYNDDLLIEAVTLSQDLEDGTRATVELVAREAYDVYYPPPKRKGRERKLIPVFKGQTLLDASTSIRNKVYGIEGHKPYEQPLNERPNFSRPLKKKTV